MLTGEGAPLVELGLDEEGKDPAAYLVLADKDGRAAAALSGRRSGPFVRLSDYRGQVRASLELGANGKPELTRVDEEGYRAGFGGQLDRVLVERGVVFQALIVAVVLVVSVIAGASILSWAFGPTGLWQIGSGPFPLGALAVALVMVGIIAIQLSEHHWFHHPDADDLAVAPLRLVDSHKYQFKWVGVDLFLTQQAIEEHNIGPGDDVFMVGRFVTHDGRQRNTPSLRFGDISMMPRGPVMHPRGYTVESFLVETRSLSGYSGSPVCVSVPKNILRPARERGTYSPREGGFWLLGVDWGHIPIYENVLEKNREDEIPEGWVVESNSGQMAVAPAWKLKELLDMEELAVVRRNVDYAVRRQKEQSPVTLDMRTKRAPDSDESAESPEDYTRGGFFTDLKKAARKRPQPSQHD